MAQKTCLICGGPFVAAKQGRRCASCKAKIKAVWKDLVRGAYGDAIEIVTRETARLKASYS